MLATIAAERTSDLIVTGVARYNSIGDYFLGPAVDHIIRNAAQPVLVVRRRVTGAYDRLLVATDLSDCSREAFLAAAALDRQSTRLHPRHECAPCIASSAGKKHINISTHASMIH